MRPMPAHLFERRELGARPRCPGLLVFASFISRLDESIVAFARACHPQPKLGIRQGFVYLTLRDTRLSLFRSRLVVHRLPQCTREARGINGESDVLVLRS